MKIYAPPANIDRPDIMDFVRGRLDYAGLQLAENDYIAELKDFAKRTADGSNIAGELISVPYADGAAHYIVVKSSGKHGLMHVPIGDAWRDPQFERLATVKEVTDMIRRDRAFRKRTEAQK